MLHQLASKPLASGRVLQAESQARGLLQREVAGGEGVGMAEAEQQKNVGGPGPDAFDRGEAGMGIRRLQCAELGQVEPAARGFGERAKRANFRVGKADGFQGPRRSAALTASAVSGDSAASSRPKIAAALAVETCCATMIAASPAKPGARRRNGGWPLVLTNIAATSQPRPSSASVAASSAAGPSIKATTGFGGGGAGASACFFDGFAAPRGGPLAVAAFVGFLRAPARPRHWRIRLASRSLSDPRAVLRFAPSPNGRLHLGHAYSALCNARLAERLDGRLLLRIEDLDASRCKREYETALIEDLDWLGLRFEPAPRRQSEHAADYFKGIEALVEQGLAYPCLCSRAEVAAMAADARDPDGAPRHGPRACKRDAEETQERMRGGASPAWRLDMREATARAGDIWRWLEFGEGACGQQREGRASVWGDVLLTGASRAASYHLAVVLDDSLQDITDVVRGRDVLEATAVHRLLQGLIGLPAPNYHHHRLVVGEAGVKLSKSLKSPVFGGFARRKGFSAADVREMLGFGEGPASVMLA